MCGYIHNEIKPFKVVFIVMDNASIHAPSIIDPIIIKRGYIPLYSPEPNPIACRVSL
jgi:transposase